MTHLDEFMTPAQRRQTDENLKLARQFLNDYSRAPDSFPGYVQGAPFVLLPPGGAGNEALRESNMQMVQQLMLQGRNVIVHEMGSSADERLQSPQQEKRERQRTDWNTLQQSTDSTSAAS